MSSRTILIFAGNTGNAIGLNDLLQQAVKVQEFPGMPILMNVEREGSK